MSGRGRGRGGGGRGQPRREQPGRGGVGGGRGRGNAPTPTEARQPAVVSPSTASSSSLSRDFQTKVTVSSLAPAPVQSPSPVTVPAPTPSPSQAPVQSTEAPVQTLPSSSKDIRPPARPGYGSLGSKCVVRANHFIVEFADSDIHHYDVTITPEVTSKKVCREIIHTLCEMYRESHLGKRRLAYDGKKSAFAAGPLPFESKEFVVKRIEKDGAPSRREREFRVSIKFAAKPDIFQLRQFLRGRHHDAPQETIQALDVVLRATTSIKYEAIGRSLFSPQFGEGRLGDGIDFWKGFYQSLRPTQMGLSLNIDMSATAFYQPILVTGFVEQFLGRDLSRPLSDQDHSKVKKALRNVKFEVNHTGYVRRYKVTGLSTQPIHQLTFQDDTGVAVSVVRYFHEKYDIVLKYAFLPAIQAGTDAKPKYLPMEICKIVPGQHYLKKLNERQVTALLRATCQRPSDREGSILKTVTSNNFNSDKLVNEDFGIQVGAQLTNIDARVLPPPQLKYHDTSVQREVKPMVGQWNMIDKKMVNGATIDFWTCVNFSRQREDLVWQFCCELGSMCQNKGMVFNFDPLIDIRSAYPNTIEKTLVDIHAQSTAQLRQKGHTGKQLQLLIVILPDASGLYGKIKRICETELGIVSQCCQPKKVPRPNIQYLENVALKINVKAGGRNTVLVNALQGRIPYVTDRPTIIFGADVTHPKPGEDSIPSIAAVVASMDWPEVTKYRGLVSAQTHRVEIIQDLYKSHQDPQRGLVHGGMIREHLIAFRRATGHKPHRIIFYRDGVSEGQFNEVLLEEMDKIRKACVSLEPNYLPPVTFVVVQKRHHTRLFPARHGDRNTTDRSGNILPGTVVDTKICHPTEFDFYLCSHAGIQGTSRPAHYHVLYDENKFTADALQMLTNSLCYTYARCTRSVSIVPPAYYAHLAAFRARYYVEGDFSESESTAGGRATRERNAEVRPLPVIKDNVKDVMFYC